MIAVVLAAGRGRRLAASDGSLLASPEQRAAAARGLKALMPVGHDGRRLVDHAIARLVEAGCDDIVLVAPPDHDALAAHMAGHPHPDARVRIAVQAIPDGTAGAVAAAAEALHGAGDCLVVNGDNLYPVDAIRTLVTLDGAALAGFTRRSLERESGYAPERIAAFATVAHRDGWVTALDEKPPVDRLDADALVSMNLWRLSPAVRRACADVAPSSRGERELPAAVMLAIARGSRVRVVPVEGRVLDLTTADDVTIVSEALASPVERG
ncbi:MAG: NTP transferase domain-containing protein [Vicinamibacterales bacterium]